MVKRRNSRYKAFAWGAPRRVPIDCTPTPADPIAVTPQGRTRRQRTLWSPQTPSGSFI
jgi:hypothetical protein